MPNMSRSSVFKVNPEGFKRWGQPNWELNMWLPVYDKRLGNIAYTGIPKTDISSSDFTSQRISTFEFGVGSANDVEGRAILNTSSASLVGYTIGNGDSTTDNYPNYPNPITLANTANTILNFVSSNGQYLITTPSYFHQVEVRGDGRLDDTSDIAINSAVGYSLVLKGSFGDFLFNKALVFISNSLTNESYLFGILYFNTNITKRAFTSTNGQTIPDVKIRFNVMLTTSSNSNLISETEMDNYIVFGASSDFVNFGQVEWSPKTIASGEGLDAILRGSVSLQTELSQDEFLAFQGANLGTYGALAQYGSGFIQTREGWFGNVLRKSRNLLATDATKSQLLSGTLETDIYTDNTDWLTANIQNSFGYRVRSVIGYGANSTPSPLTHKYGLRFNNIINSDLIGHDALLNDVKNSDGHIFGDYGDSDSSTYTYKTAQNLLDNLSNFSFWGAYAHGVRNSIFRGYNIKLDNVESSSVIGKCLQISALFSNIHGQRTVSDSSTQFNFGTAELDSVFLGSGQGTANMQKSYAWLDMNPATDAQPAPLLALSAFTGFDLKAIGTSIISSNPSVLSDFKAYSAIASLSKNKFSDVNIEYTSLSGEILHSDINANFASVSNAYHSDIFMKSSISEGVFRSDMIVSGIKKYLFASLEATTNNVGTTQYTGLGYVNNSDPVKSMIDRFLFLSNGYMNLQSFGIVTNSDGTFDIGASTGGSFGVSDYSAISLYPIVSGNLTYNTIVNGAPTSSATGSASYYMQLADGVDFSSSGSLGFTKTALQLTYINTWRMRSIEQVAQTNHILRLSAYGDVPLTSLIDMTSGSAPSYLSDDTFTTATASGSAPMQNLKLSTVNGGFASLNLYDIVANVDSDLPVTQSLLTVAGQVRLARMHTPVVTASYDTTFKVANVSFPQTTSLKTWNFQTKAVVTNSVNNNAHLTSAGLFTANTGNWYVTMLIRAKGASDDNGQIYTFKVSNPSKPSSNISMALTPVGYMTEASKTALFSAINAGTVYVGMNFWAVDDTKNATLQSIWASQNEYFATANSFYIGVSDENSPSTVDSIGVVRVVRFGLFHSMASRINSEESTITASVNSTIDLVDSLVGRVDGSIVNSLSLTAGDLKGCTIVGSNIRIRPINPISSIVYNLKNGANTYTTASVVKNRVENSLFMGKNINVDIIPISYEWLGDYNAGALKSFSVNGDTTYNPVSWMLTEKQGRIKNVFMFGDSIHTTTGTFQFSGGYDQGLTSWFLNNSGTYEISNDDKLYMPLQGLSDAFIYGRDIYLSSTSGSLEAVNAFGRFINLEHSWITVFGRYNEWYSANIEQVVGRDFFVVANGKSTSVGGGYYNTGTYANAFTRRYNMFSITDRGVTKVRSLVKSGALWRSNPSFALAFAKMDTMVSSTSWLFYPSQYGYTISGGAPVLATNSSDSYRPTNHSSYMLPYTFTEQVRDCLIMMHATTGLIYPSLLRSKVTLNSTSTRVELSDDINFLAQGTDNNGLANIVIDNLIADYAETCYAPVQKLASLYGTVGSAPADSGTANANPVVFNLPYYASKFVPVRGLKVAVPGKYTINLKLSDWLTGGTSTDLGQFTILVATASSSTFSRSNLTVAGVLSNALVADYLDFQIAGSLKSKTQTTEIIASFTTTVANEVVYFVGYHLPVYTDTTSSQEIDSNLDSYSSNMLLSAGITQRQYLKDYMTVSFDGYLKQQSVWNSTSPVSATI